MTASTTHSCTRAGGARIVAGSLSLGILGEVHPSVVARFGIERHPVGIFELALHNVLDAMPGGGPRYMPVGRFPSAIRDLSILVDLGVPAAKIQHVIESEPLVNRVLLFDVYTGEKVPAGKRSLGYHIHFQSPERTLTADEVSRAFRAVVDSPRAGSGSRAPGVGRGGNEQVVVRGWTMLRHITMNKLEEGG